MITPQEANSICNPMLELAMGAGTNEEKGIVLALEFLSQHGIKCSIVHESIHYCIKDLDKMLGIIDNPDSIHRSSIEKMTQEKMLLTRIKKCLPVPDS